MDNESTKTENFVKSFSKRVLAFKALRQLRVEVDKIDKEEVVKKINIIRQKSGDSMIKK